ncbi:hypothetical protein BC936DRAFT_138056 [Jimgerdemannia flammicorona]|uniref:Uncharacterized protein n=1 Tax=Jimgerdemannia flammicorona TaxID=994334 RepID=A0A433CW00_9FUNG|nr:hypothetical protein BC936DRAFT_138056 [Jimgerdemannia flammicorona]
MHFKLAPGHSKCVVAMVTGLPQRSKLLARLQNNVLPIGLRQAPGPTLELAPGPTLELAPGPTLELAPGQSSASTSPVVDRATAKPLAQQLNKLFTYLPAVK